LIRDIGLVIFDKDGTLIELYHYWSQMVALRARLICDALGLGAKHEAGLRRALGVDEKAERLRPEGPVGLKKREVVIQAAVDYLSGLGLQATASICSEAFNQADEESCRDLQRFIRPIPGAGSLLEQLHASGCRVAIATVDVSRRARLAVDFLGFADYVDLTVGGDQVTRSKPDPEMIHLILKRLGIGRAAAVMVGDSLNDVEMGVAAGLKSSIGVLTGLASRDQLLSVTPFVVPDISNIALVLGKKIARDG
jgi:phosphoglycolate phosphatase